MFIKKYRNRLEEIEKESAGIRQKLVGLLNEAILQEKGEWCWFRGARPSYVLFLETRPYEN